MNDARNWIAPSIALSLATIALAACVSSSEPAKNDDQIDGSVRAVLEAQQAAWNRGDIDAFMDGYDRAETTTFVSGDELFQGWQKVLERYKQRYKSRDEMGTLTFSDLSVKPISADFALADGRWQLIRANDKPNGRFTLLFQRIKGSWRIIHDTTTAATP
jgi:ketosteroid isomerase-like protein